MITVAVALFVIIIWTTYRLLFPENIILDELVFKPIFWLTPVIIVTKFKQLGTQKLHLIRNLCLGIIIGLFFSLERVFVNHLEFRFSLIFLITPLFTAITEEIFFRGYLLSRWLKYFKNPLYPMILNGLFFTSTHIPIAILQYHYTGHQLINYLIVNFTTGFVDIILFYFTGTVYASIANHFIWNVFSGLFR